MAIRFVKNIEVKTLQELREQIGYWRALGYKPKRSDYFQFLNENINNIICWLGDSYISIEYIGD